MLLHARRGSLGRLRSKGFSVEVHKVPHYSRRPAATVEVWAPQTNDQVSEWVNRYVVGEGRGVPIGFDIEWRPEFRTGQRNKVALVQIACGGSVMLVQLNRFRGALPPSLIDLICSPSIRKVGVGVLDDLRLLQRDFGTVLSTAYVDLGLAAKRLVDTCPKEYNSMKTFGLTSLCLNFLNVELPKPRRVRMGNWEAVSLSSDQITYAAYDALLSLDVHSFLDSRGVFSETAMSDFVEAQSFLCSGRGQVRKLFSLGLESPEMRQKLARKLVASDDVWLSDPARFGYSSALAPDLTATTWSQSLFVVASRFAISPHFKYRREGEETVVEVYEGNGSRLLGVGTGSGKLEAKENACKQICQVFLRLQHRLINSVDILSLYSGKGDTGGQHQQLWSTMAKEKFA